MGMMADQGGRVAIRPMPAAYKPIERSKALVPVRRRPPAVIARPGYVRLVLVTLLILGVLGSGVLYLRGDATRGDPLGDLAEALTRASGALGLTLKEITVEGRGRTSTQALSSALDARLGLPLLGLDAEAMRQRVEALPWVESAVIERRLPTTLAIRLTERRPFALWQHDGAFDVIDARGRPIAGQDAAAFADLPHVVGADAATEAEALTLMLQVEPALDEQVAAATRVGGRRWDVLMKNGVTIRLPEEDPATAWSRLAGFERAHGILERAVVAIDLRLPDRVAVRLTPEAIDALYPPKPAPGAGKPAARAATATARLADRIPQPIPQARSFDDQ